MITDTTLENLQTIHRAARHFVEVTGAQSRLQFDARQKAAWDELVQALFDGRSLKTRAMEQFNEQRDAAIKRTSP